MVTSLFLSLTNNDQRHRKRRFVSTLTHSTQQQRRSLRPTNILPLGCHSHTVLLLLLLLTTATNTAPLMLTWHSSRGPGDVCVCVCLERGVWVSAQTVVLNRNHFLTSSTESEMDENRRELEMCERETEAEGGEEIGAEVAVCLLVLPVIVLDGTKQALTDNWPRFGTETEAGRGWVQEMERGKII